MTENGPTPARPFALLGSVASLCLALLSLGCAPRHTMLAGALDKAYAFECPPDRIRVLGHRRIGADELWALDACGVRIEVERGLEFPSSASNLKVLTERDIQDIRESLSADPAQSGSKAVVSEPIVQAARAKARELCVLGDAGNRFAVSNSNLDELAACQRRLEEGTAPLGNETDDQGVVRYWFRVGSWAFPSFMSYHAPSCSRLTLSDTLEYCECEKAAGRRASCDAAVVARAAATHDSEAEDVDGAPPAQSDARRSAEQRTKWYARGGLGLGYLASTGGDTADISAMTLDWNLWGGALIHPRFALGIGVSSHQGLSEQSVAFDYGGAFGDASWRPDSLAACVFVSGMPAPVPLRLDLEVGPGILIRAAPRADAGRSRSFGFYGAVGLGWEVAGESVDVGFTGKAFLMNTEDGASTFQTTGYGLVVGLGAHPRQPIPPD